MSECLLRLYKDTHLPFLPPITLWKHITPHLTSNHPNQDPQHPSDAVRTLSSNRTSTLYLSSMSGNAIPECQDLVTSGITILFKEADPTLIEEHPDRIVEWRAVSLWAQNLGTGTKWVNLRRPSILRFLRGLADKGIGPAEEHDGVRYKFVTNKTSGTTTPISSL